MNRDSSTTKASVLVPNQALREYHSVALMVCRLVQILMESFSMMKNEHTEHLEIIILQLVQLVATMRHKLGVGL